MQSKQINKSSQYHKPVISTASALPIDFITILVVLKVSDRAGETSLKWFFLNETYSSGNINFYSSFKEENLPCIRRRYWFSLDLPGHVKRTSLKFNKSKYRSLLSVSVSITSPLDTEPDFNALVLHSSPSFWKKIAWKSNCGIWEQSLHFAKFPEWIICLPEICQQLWGIFFIAQSAQGYK